MSTPPWLNPTKIDFPPIEKALTDPNGLLAVGGDLSTERLIEAYRLGIFPWFDDTQPILWWSPSPRAVLFPANIVISRSLRKRLKRNQYRVSCDQCFELVIQHCAQIPRHGQSGTWITEEMLAAYQQLFTIGVAHSLEVWENDNLVGGLYGLAIGKVFYGESMFSLATDASKVAFVHLAKQLEKWGFPMIDCQVSNPHLLTLGAEEIDRSQFKQLLADNIDASTNDLWPGKWDNLIS